MDVNWLLLVVAGRNDVKESPGFLEKLANRFVPHVGAAKLGANWSLYAQGGYQFAAGEPGNGIRRDGVKGDFGVRYTW